MVLELCCRPDSDPQSPSGRTTRDGEPDETDPGLTLRTPYSDHDPGALYAEGVRNYVRVVAPDDAIGSRRRDPREADGSRAGRRIREPRGDRIPVVRAVVGGGFVETARSLGLVTTELEWRRSKELHVDREASRGRATAARLLRRAYPEQRQAFARGRSPPGRPRRGVRRRRPVHSRAFTPGSVRSRR